jgi:hypothetical protein
VTPPQRDGGSHEEPRSTPPPGASSGPTDAGSRASGDRLEFGGAPGALAIITLSHLVAYYVLLCVAKRQGRLYPLPLSSAAFAALLADLRELAAPTLASWAVYLGFLGTQLALALVCPGPVVHGYPVTKSGERADDADDAAGKKKDARRLPYKCNALSAWWVTLLTVGLGTVVFGDAPLVWVADNRGRLLTCAVCVGDVGSLVFYLKGVLAREKDASSGLSSSQKKTKKKHPLRLLHGHRAQPAVVRRQTGLEDVRRASRELGDAVPAHRVRGGEASARQTRGGFFLIPKTRGRFPERRRRARGD